MVKNTSFALPFADILYAENLSKHCTFKIGGQADFFVSPKSFDEVISMVDWCKQNNLRYKIIGNGSNLLFNDDGFNGLVVCTNKIKGINQIDETTLEVYAGENLNALVMYCAKHNLKGIENLIGIPGTVGGALFMNAGAFGCSFCDVVNSVTFFDGKNAKEVSVNELAFGYRTSYFKNHEAVIISAKLKFKKAESVELLTKINDIINIRKQKQPIGFSAGSVFKAVDGEPAGKLIDQCGLKGLKFGGAEISGVHANFILNTNNATFSDVMSLINLTKACVKDKLNKDLQLEIEIV